MALRDPLPLREEGAPLFQDVVVEEGNDNDNDNGRLSSEFEGNYDTPDESEDDATKCHQRAREEKERRQIAARHQEQEGKDKKERWQDAGDTLNGWETVIMNGQHEHGNTFNGLSGPEFYYSWPFNRVFIGLEVQAAAHAEHAGEYFSSSMQLYEVVPWGMPMNPEEVRQLVLFMRGHARNTPPYDRVMAQRMLMELDHIMQAVPPDMWDRTMQAFQAFPGLAQDFRERIIPHNEAWHRVSWGPDPQARVGNPSNLNQGAGLQPVYVSRGLDIDEWCRYILHHGYPGSPNLFTGVAMDFVLRVERSAFGYALGRALCPTEARSQFMRHFAMVLARPELYCEFIREYEALYPQHLFVPQSIAAPMVH
ncbi:hypothetical protein H0H92_009279 [Tricholoma furcatifolium]|nr:hypothetical protein H0H92_009279 [Tricholoma furcatifolium]